MARLLIVHHSPTETVRSLTDAVVAGAQDDEIDQAGPGADRGIDAGGSGRLRGHELDPAVGEDPQGDGPVLGAAPAAGIDDRQRPQPGRRRGHSQPRSLKIRNGPIADRSIRPSAIG